MLEPRHAPQRITLTLRTSCASPPAVAASSTAVSLLQLSFVESHLSTRGITEHPSQGSTIVRSVIEPMTGSAIQKYCVRYTSISARSPMHQGFPFLDSTSSQPVGLPHIGFIIRKYIFRHICCDYSRLFDTHSGFNNLCTHTLVKSSYLRCQPTSTIDPYIPWSKQQPFGNNKLVSNLSLGTYCSPYHIAKPSGLPTAISALYPNHKPRNIKIERLAIRQCAVQIRHHGGCFASALVPSEEHTVHNSEYDYPNAISRTRSGLGT